MRAGRKTEFFENQPYPCLVQRLCNLDSQIVSTAWARYDQPHDIQFTADIARSSWVAVRHFPQLHTNPVNVLVANKPIRASRASALWCIETIELLWQNRQMRISAGEREAASAAFQRAIERFGQIAQQSPDDR